MILEPHQRGLYFDFGDFHRDHGTTQGKITHQSSPSRYYRTSIGKGEDASHMGSSQLADRMTDQIVRLHPQ
ncbi:hypothetical protein D5S18_30240 [Nocardia panacis]|uniref:Uncharacterized protein n=1 Tax=Nocardia panacis TaxID=2340916 RepID=A0A3A4KJX5_9NOCA|nr:hypothetical protein D5S18_30240 [Nocardia panacis]